MRLSDDADATKINWKNEASAIRRHAERLPPSARRVAEIDRALACEAHAHSGDLLHQTRMG